MTSALTEALTWSVTSAELCMFTVSGGSAPIELPTGSGTSPSEVRHYDLEAPSGVLNGLRVEEFDLVFPVVPDDLAEVVRSWLSSATTQGAKLAWFAFEGSFHFDHILTADVAHQVYGVAIPDNTHLALEDSFRRSSDWVRVLDEVKRSALSNGPSYLEEVLHRLMGQQERDAIMTVRERRTSGVEELTFNVSNVVLDFDAQTATVADELDDSVSQTVSLAEFFSRVEATRDQ